MTIQRPYNTIDSGISNVGDMDEFLDHTYSRCQRFQSQSDDFEVNSIAIYDYASCTGDVHIKVYDGDANNPDTSESIQEKTYTYTFTGSGDWVNINLDDPIFFDENEYFWISIKFEGVYRSRTVIVDSPNVVIIDNSDNILYNSTVAFFLRAGSSSSYLYYDSSSGTESFCHLNSNLRYFISDIINTNREFAFHHVTANYNVGTALFARIMTRTGTSLPAEQAILLHNNTTSRTTISSGTENIINHMSHTSGFAPQENHIAYCIIEVEGDIGGINNIEYKYWQPLYKTFHGHEGPSYVADEPEYPDYIVWTYAGTRIHYHISFPKNYDSEDTSKVYPLVINTGGDLTQGCDPLEQTSSYMWRFPATIFGRRLFANNYHDPQYECIIITYQMPTLHTLLQIAGNEVREPYRPNGNLGAHGYTFLSQEDNIYPGAIAAIIGLIEHLIRHEDYNIDINRIYGAAFSRGAYYIPLLATLGRHLFSGMLMADGTFMPSSLAWHPLQYQDSLGFLRKWCERIKHIVFWHRSSAFLIDQVGTIVNFPNLYEFDGYTFPGSDGNPWNQLVRWNAEESTDELVTLDGPPYTEYASKIFETGMVNEVGGCAIQELVYFGTPTTTSAIHNNCLNIYTTALPYLFATSRDDRNNPNFGVVPYAQEMLPGYDIDDPYPSGFYLSPVLFDFIHEQHTKYIKNISDDKRYKYLGYSNTYAYINIDGHEYKIGCNNDYQFVWDMDGANEHIFEEPETITVSVGAESFDVTWQYECEDGHIFDINNPDIDEIDCTNIIMKKATDQNVYLRYKFENNDDSKSIPLDDYAGIDEPGDYIAEIISSKNIKTKDIAIDSPTNKGLAFKGQHYINIPSYEFDIKNTFDGARTFTFWAYMSEIAVNTYYGIISLSHPTSYDSDLQEFVQPGGFDVYVYNGVVNFRLRKNYELNTSPQITATRSLGKIVAGKWYFFVVSVASTSFLRGTENLIIDDDNIQVSLLYKDLILGEKESQFLNTNSLSGRNMNPTSVDIKIGTITNTVFNGNYDNPEFTDVASYYLKGGMSDLRIYHKLLSTEEIEDIFAEGELYTEAPYVNPRPFYDDTDCQPWDIRNNTISQWRFEDKDDAIVVRDNLSSHEGIVYANGYGNLSDPGTFKDAKGPGLFGNAFLARGNEVIEYNENILFNLNESYSYSFWFYSDSFAEIAPIISLIDSSGRGYALTRFVFDLTYLGSSATIPTLYLQSQSIDEYAGWHHVVITHDGNTNQTEIYYNGRQTNINNTHVVLPFEGPVTLKINDHKNMRDGGKILLGYLDLYFDDFDTTLKGYSWMKIDEFYVFNKCLDMNEILGLYNNGHGTQQMYGCVQPPKTLFPHTYFPKINPPTFSLSSPKIQVKIGDFYQTIESVSPVSAFPIANKVMQIGDNLFRNVDYILVESPVEISLSSEYVEFDYSELDRDEIIGSQNYLNKQTLYNWSEIRYTTNGDNPTNTSKLYVDPIVIDKITPAGEEITIKTATYYLGNKSPIITIKLKII